MLVEVLILFMMNLQSTNRFETIELFNELMSLDDKDILFAKNKSSFGKFKNDLELYIYVCDNLMEELITLEEYELCSDLKKLHDKLTESLD